MSKKPLKEALVSNKPKSIPVAKVIVEKAVIKAAPHIGTLDLKETTEMIDALELILDGGIDILKDGEVDWKDSLVALRVLKNYKLFAEAVKDHDMIPAELKKISEVEACMLVKALYPLLKKVKELTLLAKKLK